MMYDVGTIDLNLRQACNRVLDVLIVRSFAREGQLCGRALREITSELSHVRYNFDTDRIKISTDG